MELAGLDWAWNPTRTPRETKLMLRQQRRLNELRTARIAATVRLFETLVPVFVDERIDPGELHAVSGKSHAVIRGIDA